MGRRIPLPEEPISEKAAVEQYDKGARRYMMPEYRYFVKKVLSRGIKGGTVLDIGTGSGLLALELCKAKDNLFDITAVDISENMIRKAAENASEAGVGGNINFLLSAGASLPFPDNAFDLVISYASLHHWLEPVTVFNEVERVVKQSGRIIIRDDMRIYHNPFLKVMVWVISRFMNRNHRESWARAMWASYTVPEVKTLLSKSRLKDYRVCSDFVLVDLCIESPGR